MANKPRHFCGGGGRYSERSMRSWLLEGTNVQFAVYDAASAKKVELGADSGKRRKR